MSSSVTFTASASAHKLLGASSAPIPIRQQARLHHSKSVNIEFLPSCADSVPSTPRARPSAARRIPRRSTFNNGSSTRKTASASPTNGSPFAGSKFSDSPSARHLPLPPVNWFEDDEMLTAASSLSSACSISSDTESVSSNDSAIGMRKSPTGGIRITALQLIAACAAS